MTFESIVEFAFLYRLELLIVTLLVALAFSHRRWKRNVFVAAYLERAADVIASRMEEARGETGGSLTRKKRTRRKVRRTLAKQARRANRGTSKGQKRGQ